MSVRGSLHWGLSHSPVAILIENFISFYNLPSTAIGNHNLMPCLDAVLFHVVVCGAIRPDPAVVVVYDHIPTRREVGV
jgi:hypothetical protein